MIRSKNDIDIRHHTPDTILSRPDQFRCKFPCLEYYRPNWSKQFHTENKWSRQLLDKSAYSYRIPTNRSTVQFYLRNIFVSDIAAVFCTISMVVPRTDTAAIWYESEKGESKACVCEWAAKNAKMQSIDLHGDRKPLQTNVVCRIVLRAMENTREMCHRSIVVGCHTNIQIK